MSDKLSFADPEDWIACSLGELCQRCALDEQFIIACVEYGVADVPGASPPDWIFTGTSVLRIQKAWRLHRDLDLQVSSLALILELLDERSALQQEVGLLRQRLQLWEKM